MDGSRAGGGAVSRTGVAGVTRCTSNWSRHSAAGPGRGRISYVTSAALPHHLHNRSHTMSVMQGRDVHGSGPSMGWVGLGPVVKFSKNFCP